MSCFHKHALYTVAHIDAQQQSHHTQCDSDTRLGQPTTPRPCCAAWHCYRCSSSAILWRRAAAALQRCSQLQHVTLDRCLISTGVIQAIPQLRRLLLSTSSLPPEELQQPADAEAMPALIKVADLTPLRHLRGLKELQMFNLAPQECSASPAAAGGGGEPGAADEGQGPELRTAAVAAAAGYSVGPVPLAGLAGARAAAAAAASGTSDEPGHSAAAATVAAGDPEASTAAATAVGCLPSALEQLQLCVESIGRWLPHLAVATSLTTLHIFYNSPSSLHSQSRALAGNFPPQLRSLTICMDGGCCMHPSDNWQGLRGLKQLQLEGCWVDCNTPECWSHLAAVCGGGLQVLRGLLLTCAPPPEMQLEELRQLTVRVGCLRLEEVRALLSACPALRGAVLTTSGYGMRFPTAEVSLLLGPLVAQALPLRHGMAAVNHIA